MSFSRAVTIYLVGAGGDSAKDRGIRVGLRKARIASKNGIRPLKGTLPGWCPAFRLPGLSLSRTRVPGPNLEQSREAILFYMYR